MARTDAVRHRTKVASHTEKPVISGEFVCKNDAGRHRTMVASHTATPLGVAKWLVRGAIKNNSLPLGRRHGLLESLTWDALVPYLKARFRVWVSPSPAISPYP